MKKIFIVFTAAVFVVSCGNNENKDNKDASNMDQNRSEATKTVSTGMTPEQQHGLDLVTSNDCLGCHKVADKLVGPAYLDVAKRYAGKPGIEDTLVKKIIKGGAGNWGTVPMQPHPNVSEADAKAMVAYILSTPNQ